MQRTQMIAEKTVILSIPCKDPLTKDRSSLLVEPTRYFAPDYGIRDAGIKETRYLTDFLA